MNNKKRIEFIDLAKGLCIMLIICVHCGCPISNYGQMESVVLSLYFVLSGLFFKDYGGFLQLTVKKLNQLLIPFLFFYLSAYLVFYVVQWLKPGLIVTDANGILDVFYQVSYFNGPIWFLLSLFWVSILFCIIKINLHKEYQRCIAVLLFASIGIAASMNNIFIPCMFGVSLTALPFFYIGYLFYRTPIVYQNKADKYNLIIAISLGLFSWGLYYLDFGAHIDFSRNNLHGNFLMAYVCVFAQALALFFLCKAIGKMPLISYAGRYSLVLLALHHMIYRPLGIIINRFDLPYPEWINAILTILVCVALIEPCRRIIPWFIGQKELVKMSSKTQPESSVSV